VGVQALDHAARPPLTLDREPAQARRDRRERDRSRLERGPPSMLDQRPGGHDVLADPVGPATGEAHRLCPVDAEGALSHQRRAEEGLLALHRRDPQLIVPLLHPRHEPAAAVANEHRARDRNRADGVDEKPGDDAAQRRRDEQRVRIDRRDERRRGAGQTQVERCGLPAMPGLDQRHMLVGLGQTSHDVTGAVARAVVDHQHRDGARVVLREDGRDRLLDPVLLVVGRDQHRHGRLDRRVRRQGLRTVEEHARQKAARSDSPGRSPRPRRSRPRPAASPAPPDRRSMPGR